MKFNEIKTPTPENHDEWIFRQYEEILDLKPEDFKKKILDIGAGSARFAKWAKEHGLSEQIYSLEPKKKSPLEKSKAVSATAEEIPFKDNSFDLEVSLYAIPFIYHNEKIRKKKEMDELVHESLKEELRVLKIGGEIRFGPFPAGNAMEAHAAIGRVVDAELTAREDSGEIQVEYISLGTRLTAEKEEKWYLVKIKKLR